MDFSVKLELCDDEKTFVGYANEENAILAISMIKMTTTPDTFKWSVVHVPTGTVILNLFRTRSEAEKFMRVLSEFVELDSLLFLTEGDVLMQNLYPHIEEAYKKFNVEFRRHYERLGI